MIHLSALWIFLSLTAKLANADLTASVEVLTLNDRTDLTCCLHNQTTSNCLFSADSIDIGQQNSSGPCCNLTVSGNDLLQGKTDTELRATVTIQCTSKSDDKRSQNVTISVWRICFSKYTLVFLVIPGTLILFSFLFIIIICLIYMTKNQDKHGANSVQVQEDKTGIVEDELLYATVNHSGAGENSAPAVELDAGTVYATVVIH